MKIIEIVTPIENFSAVESIITRHDSEILWVNADEDKKKKLIHLICRIKGEKVYDDYTEVGNVEVNVDDVELVVEKMMGKKLKLEIKSGV